MAADTFAHYRIEQTIGEGPAGSVYAGLDLRDDRPLTIKVMHAALSLPRLRERFVREMSAMTSVISPGLARIHEVGAADGRFYVATEQLEGESLARCVARGALPVDECVRVGVAVLGALEVLHAHGTVHRNLKPTNVFLCHGQRVVLLDSGQVGALSGQAPASAAVAVSQAVMMAPCWMSPEQARGGRVDLRSDLFVLGTLLREAATGERLFDSDSVIEQMYSVLHEQPPELNGTPARLVFGRVIERAMRKRADARFRDAAAMAAELREVPADGDPPPGARRRRP